MTQYYKKDENGEFVEAKLDEEDINEAVKSRIDRINHKYADYEDIKKQNADFAEKQKTLEDQIKNLNDEKESLNKEVSTAKLAVDRIKIMNEFNLNEDLAEFVKGDTVDEMRERAEKLSRNTSNSVVLEKKDKAEVEESQNVKICRSLFARND